MKSLFISICIACLTVGAWQGAAETPGANPLTVADCIRIGLERSAAAANAARDEQIAYARIRQARGDALPHLSMNADYTRLDELEEVDFGEEIQEAGTLDNYSVTASLRQILYGGGRVQAALRAAQVSRRHARLSRDEAEARITRDIRVLFYTILYAREEEQVYRSSLEQLQALLAETEEKQRRGAASEFDVLGAKVDAANERPKLLQAQNNAALAVEELARMLNMPAEELHLAGTLEYVPVHIDMDVLQSMAVSDRSALQAVRAVSDLRREAVVAAAAAAKPELAATASYNGANSYRFVSFSDEWQWHWNAGLRLTWDFWDGGLTRGVVAEKELDYAKALTDLEDAVRGVRLEVKQAYLRMKHARETVESSRENVALAQRALDIAQTRYAAGLATRLELTDANLGLSVARLSWSGALLAHVSAVAELEYASGVPLIPRDTGGGDVFPGGMAGAVKEIEP